MAIVGGPSLLALTVVDAAGEGEKVDVIDGDPWGEFVGHGFEIWIGLYSALVFNLKRA